MLRGTVRMEPSPMFRSCDLAVNAAFLDSTRSRVLPTYQFLGATEENGLYLVARGALSPRGEAILREIEFAAVPSETDGCEQVAPSYVVLARGVNPSWRVTVTESSMEFAQSDEPSRIEFPAGSPIDSAQAVVYRSTAIGVETHNLQLTLRRTGCHEGNHIYTAIRAELRLDGRVLTGCAWRGRLP
jgi:uncharacterized membrane protein